MGIKLVIIDYGMGNLHSIAKAFTFLGVRPVVSNKRRTIRLSDGIILPGVGAFSQAMYNLKQLQIDDIIKEEILVKKKPFLGICLGLQLLFTTSTEGEVKSKGLNIFPGDVVKLSKRYVKILPHMGWNTVKFVCKTDLTRNIRDNSYFYFAHSYHVRPKDDIVTLGETQYEKITFVSFVGKDNVYGVQFHPEKSGDTGLKLLKNFLQIVQR